MTVRAWDFWARLRRPKDAFRESEERTGYILDNVVDGIITIDEAGIVRTANPAAGRIFGHTAEELIGRNVSILMPEPDRSAHDEYLARYLRTGEARIIGIGRVVTGRRRDGSLFPLDLSIGEFRVGARRYFTGVVRDISERRRSVEAVARLAAIVESSDDAIVGKDLDGVVTSWNAGTGRIFGYTAEEMVGRPIGLLIPPDRQHEEPAILERIRRGERVEHYESVRVTKDGRRIDVALTISPIRDAAGRITGASKIARDVTERKQAEEALRWNQTLLAEAQQLAHMGSWYWDIASDILIWSDEHYRIFGLKPQEMSITFEHGISYFHQDDRATVQASIQQAFRDHQPYECCSRVLHGDGTERIVLSRGQPEYDESDNPIRMFGTCQDITERQHAEAALQRYANRLEHLREIDLAILSSRSPREIAEAALGRIARLVPYWTACIAVYDFDRDEVEVVAADGLLREWHPPGTRFHEELKARPEINALPDGQSPTGEDVAMTESPSTLIEALRGAGMRSYVSIPLVEAGRSVGTLLLASDRPAAFASDQLEVAREVADHLAIAIRQAILLDELRSAKMRLETLSRQLIRAQEDERRKIARELHDEVGQSLTAAKIALDRLARDPARQDVGRRLGEAAATIGQALGQVRDLSRLLRPSLLDDLGLAVALHALVEGLAERAGLVAEAEVDEVRRVDPEAETACYRIAQEALTNAIKHAGATRLRVALRRLGDDLELVVDDDGAGFDVAAATARAAGGESLGMLGLRERAVLAGGRAEIISSPRGTRVRAVVAASGRVAGHHPGGEGG